MIQAAAPELSESAQLLCAAMIAIVPLAAAGLTLMNAGLGRSRSATHAMLGSLCAVAVAVLAFSFCGFSWQGLPGGPAARFTAAGHTWNWIGREPFFLRGVRFDDPRAALTVWLQLFSVGIAALIPLGAGNDRWRLGAVCLSSAILAGWTYPLFAHWCWGGGWLGQPDAAGGVGFGLLDSGEAGAIHVVGGLTALSIACILGPRRGKYAPGGIPTATPGHNAVLVLFGCFLNLVGFIGLNGSGSILLSGAAPRNVPIVAVNTSLAAAAAALAAAGITRLRFGRPDASICANGWTGGLVAASAGCTFVDPAAAVFMGAVAGAVVALAVEWLDARARVDDPAGSISVHAAGGLWGLLAAALFARTSNPDRWVAQLAGIAALLFLILPMTYGLNLALNRFYPQRVSAEGELQGLDLYELGAGAYPEFVTHREEYKFNPKSK
jgi:Amt family ammonium transporter